MRYFVLNYTIYFRVEAYVWNLTVIITAVNSFIIVYFSDQSMLVAEGLTTYGPRAETLGSFL